MSLTIIACKTLEDEVNRLLDANSNQDKVVWIESGLHNYPDKLKETLQDSINQVQDSDYIVLVFGLCGNSLLGLTSRSSTLVIPRVDDCISLFLGGNTNRREMEKSARAYYLTKGWLRYENNIWMEYQNSIKKYGLEKTRSLFRIMLKHYSHLVVIDTGAYDTEDFLVETENIASELGLELKVVPAELDLLAAALNQQWDDNFAFIAPGKIVTLKDMGSCQGQPPQGMPFQA